MRRLFLPLSLIALSLNTAFAESITTSTLPVQEVGSGHIVEPSTVLHLKTALDLALKANPEISAAQQELNALNGSIFQAKARPNPSVSAMIEDTRRATRTTTLQVNQELELGGQRAARVTAAERAYDVAIIDLKAKRSEVGSAVITAFFDVLVAQERIKLVQSFLELAQSATQAASKRVKAGRVSPLEETKSTIAESNARLELNQAQVALTTARQRLAAFWGNSMPRFEQIEGDLDHLPSLPNLSDLNTRLLDSPNLQRAKLEIERRQALVTIETRRRIPNVTVTLGTKRVEELGLNQAVLGVSVPFPVFNTNQGNIQEAVSRAEKAKDELSALQLKFTSELNTAHGRLNTARQQIESLQRDILPGSQTAYAAARKGYELGKFNFLDVLDAQRTLFQAQLQYTNALAEANRASADIHRLLGTDIAIQLKEFSHE